ncbi:hypothetical protein N9682_03010 [Candidatus Pelagibacter sp.]|nr:hypothetical protein [Candidatus Pelagibacter sp.]
MNKKLIIFFLSISFFTLLLVGHKKVLTYIFIKNFSKWTERDTNFNISKINFSKSSIIIDKISIKNKGKFFNKNIFEAESIYIEFDFKSIFSDYIVIKQLIIHKPNFYFEIKDNDQKGDKHKKIVDNLNLSEKLSKDYSPKIYTKKSKDKNFIIFSILMKNSKAHIYYFKNKDNLTLDLYNMTFSKVGNLDNKQNIKFQHYKDVLKLILKNTFIRIQDKELKNLIKNIYKIN